MYLVKKKRTKNTTFGQNCTGSLRRRGRSQELGTVQLCRRSLAIFYRMILLRLHWFTSQCAGRGCKRPTRTSARNLLVQLGAYRVREIFIQKLIFLVWRCRYSRASPTLQVLLLPTSGAPTRLQLSMGLRPPPTRTELGKGCLAFQGARLWNALPSEVRAIPHPAQFRTAAVPHSMNP